MKILSRFTTGAVALALLATGTTAANAETLSAATEGTTVEHGSVAVQPETEATTTSRDGRSLVVESS